jgi:hypothetical protein
MKMTAFWDVVPCSLVEVDSIITRMMEAVRTAETSVNFNVTTWHYIPEDSKLQAKNCYEELHILYSAPNIN